MDIVFTDRFVFRGMSMDDGSGFGVKLVQGYLRITPYSKRYLISYFHSSLKWCEHEIDPKTIGQCTGSKDIKGNFIFDGDRLSDGELIFIVYFDSDFLQWCVVDECGNTNPLQSPEYSTSQVEIIGTIHDREVTG